MSSSHLIFEHLCFLYVSMFVVESTFYCRLTLITTFVTCFEIARQRQPKHIGPWRNNQRRICEEAVAEHLHLFWKKGVRLQAVRDCLVDKCYHARGLSVSHLRVYAAQHSHLLCFLISWKSVSFAIYSIEMLDTRIYFLCRTLIVTNSKEMRDFSGLQNRPSLLEASSTAQWRS